MPTIKINLKFRWYNLWIGVYIDTKKKTLYICPFPTIVIIIKKSENKNDKNSEYYEFFNNYAYKNNN